MLRLKQEALAYELGEDWNQKKISLLESKEVVDDVLLEQIVKVMKVPKEAIRNLTDEKALNIFSNTYHDNSSILGTYNFNPIDEWKESMSSNKKLQEENKSLYKRLLQVEREKSDILQKLLEERK